MIKKLNHWISLTIAIIFLTNISLGWVEIASAEMSFTHPLNPLTELEINQAVEILKQERNLSETANFTLVALKEPEKREVLNFTPGQPFSRQVFLQVYERSHNKTYEGIVNLNTKTLTSWQEIPGVQPALLPLDYLAAEEIVKSDLRWQKAMQKRGIKDFDQVQISCWAPGLLTSTEQKAGNRLCRAISYYKGDRWNFYPRPIEGVLVTVNLNAATVDSLVDQGIIPISTENWDYDIKSLGKLHSLPKALKIIQPQGQTFTINQNEITWQDWKFRYLMHPREGLVLYLVSYKDGEKYRPILYRGSLSEMVVPYGDPNPNWSFRNAFDVGEYNLGILANKMELGKDIPDHGILLDAVFANTDGEAYTMPNVIGIYERDNGILWKHFEYNTQKNYVRRNRELVLKMTTAVDNYDYSINWIFHQDGTLEVENELSGIVLAQGTAATQEAETNIYGRLIGKNIIGVNHQHFFNYRLDLDIDGQKNSVIETNVNSLPISEKNPLGNAITLENTPLTTETTAVRDLDIKHSREWMITSHQNNTLGVPTAYMLTPGSNTIFYAVDGAKIRQKAAFATHHFWVTKYKPNELYAGGDYPNQTPPRQGLPQYIADNESLTNQDLVVWYTMGMTHVPRPEDWPVMPKHKVSFKLFPRGFFHRNPAINLPE